jgi:hypothetical protein
MNWLSNSEVAKMLKAEIKAQTGKVVNVRKNQYGNIEVDCSRHPHLRAKIEEVVSHWRAGSMGNFDNFERNTMFRLENPITGFPVVWNSSAVDYENVRCLSERVNVSYDYITIYGGKGW